MNRFMFFFIFILFFINCDDNTVQIKDHIIIVEGSVKDKDTLQPLDDVLVLFKITNVTDSVAFFCLKNNKPYSEFSKQETLTKNGYFLFQSFSSIWPPDYNNLIAYKEGYNFWKYTEKDTIYHIKQYKDSLNIYLEKTK